MSRNVAVACKDFPKSPPPLLNLKNRCRPLVVKTPSRRQRLGLFDDENLADGALSVQHAFSCTYVIISSSRSGIC